MATTRSKTEILKTSEAELVKQYQLLDAQSRPWKIYTASANAKHGDPCLVTELLYPDTSSTLIKAKIEGYAFWDTSFVPDSSFTVEDTNDSKTHIIKVNQSELVKQYQELDGQGRPSKIYEGPVFMVTGSPCKVTEYLYQSPTSTVFKGKKEGYAEWDETWVPDSSFTVEY